jgi:hypothetical protein
MAFFAFVPHYQFSVRADQAGCPEAYRFIRSFPGNRILSEDVSAVVMSGKPVMVSNPYVVTQLGNSVAWSRGSLEQLANQRYFDLIVLGGDLDHFRPETGRWSPAFINAVREQYRTERQFRCSPSLAVAYVPRTDLH